MEINQAWSIVKSLLPRPACRTVSQDHAIKLVEEKFTSTNSAMLEIALCLQAAVHPDYDTSIQHRRGVRDRINAVVAQLQQ
jgi:hypothetical protein